MNAKLRHVCPNILSVIDLVLTIPASSADAERGFNRLKMTKNDWRSRLLDTRLSDQLIIMLESAEISEYQPTPAIHLWNQTATRRTRQNKTALTIQKAEAENDEKITVAEELENLTEYDIPDKNESDNESDYFSDDDYAFEYTDTVEVTKPHEERIVDARQAYNGFCAARIK